MDDPVVVTQTLSASAIEPTFDQNVPAHHRRHVMLSESMKERALVAGYLTAVTIATLGWLSALWWFVAEVAELVIS